MLVRFWGTRGSIAKAGPLTTRYGGNTACVEIRSSRGTLIVLDCGTGAHGLGQALIKTEPRPLNGHILIGHTHWDHIQGFPFFSPLFVPGNEWHVYGPRGLGSSLRESLSGQMQYTYSPITLDDLGATLHFHDLVEGALELDDVHVTTRYLNHPALTLGYRLEVDGVTVVYSTDHEPHSQASAYGNPEPFTGPDSHHAQFLADADLVIHDAQYTAAEYASKTGWGHSTTEYVVAVAAYAGVRRLALFHHDPTRDDAAIDRLLAGARDRAAKAGGSTEVFAAAEGTVLELHGDKARTSSVGANTESARTDPALISLDRRVLVSVANPRVERLLAAAVHADGLRLLNPPEGNTLASVVHSEPLSLVLLQHGSQDDEVLQFCRSLRRDPSPSAKDVPVVLVREKENPAEQLREAAAGITDWLIWPFSEPYARTRIRAWVLGEACRWKPAPLPPDEERRLEALWACGVLDTEAEERFDRFTRIAAALFDVPIALVSLVDRDRQWFKSRRGLDATETTRDAAFCAHAILGEDVLQVPDALQDDRFADNPLVTGEQRVRFYAGAPLTLKNGTHAGTLCVMDHRARNLDSGQLQLLRDLAKLVEREFHTSPAAVGE
jgi:phosphoribosyl 1,2-cyclic phosphodiesterase/DNA-binding response OmpR family regulator